MIGLQKYEKIFRNLIKTKQMIVLNHKGFKYHNWSTVVCQKMKKGFVRINLVNVMREQVLEEEIGRDSIAKIVLELQCLDIKSRSDKYLHGLGSEII